MVHLYFQFYPPANPESVKTITQYHQEPVSEVFINGGKILRQTYIGTAPSVSPLTNDIDSPALKKKISSQTPNATKTSETKNKKDLNIAIDQARKSQTEGADNEKNLKTKVGSPYMVIKSPKLLAENDKENQSTKEQIKAEEDPNQHAKQEDETKEHESNGIDQPGSKIQSKQENDKANINELREVLNSSPVDNWLALNRERGSTVIDRFKDRYESESLASDSEQSLQVEVSSDQENLTDFQSNEDEAELALNLPESEVQSDAEIAEEESQDQEDIIQVGQSAVDFRELGRAKTAKQKVLAGYTEFPKIKEEPIEKIEYLTPKEAKAVQSARRQKSEWENMMKKKQDKGSKQATTKSKIYLTFGFKSNKKDESLNLQQDHFSHPYGKKRHKNPLIKRLVQNIEGPDAESKSKSKTGAVKIVKQSDKQAKQALNQKSHFKPIKSGDDIDKVDHPLKRDSNAESLDDIATISKFKSRSSEKKSDKKISQSPPVKTEPDFSSDFKKKRMFGHRRNKSAPLQKRKHQDKEVNSGLTKESFVYVDSNVESEEEFRGRSQSLGSRKARGQKQLTKMAEQKDRKNAERENLEIVQVCDSLLCYKDSI